jgi:hypothetical protein
MSSKFQLHAAHTKLDKFVVCSVQSRASHTLKFSRTDEYLPIWKPSNRRGRTTFPLTKTTETEHNTRMGEEAHLSPIDCSRSIGFTAPVRQESCHARAKPQENPPAERVRGARARGRTGPNPRRRGAPTLGVANRSRNPRGQWGAAAEVEAAAAGERKPRCAPGRWR